MKHEQPESVINYRDVRAQKARLLMSNHDIATASGVSNTSVSALLNGRESLSLSVIKEIAAALQMRVRVMLEPIPAMQERPIENDSEFSPVQAGCRGGGLVASDPM